MYLCVHTQTDMSSKLVSGFSKWNKAEKIQWLTQVYLEEDEGSRSILQQYWNADKELQDLHDDFIENALSNYYLPYGIAPNFVIDGQTFAIPMVTEESSVVAAASNAAKFWSERGGFQTTIVGTQKSGQIHLRYAGSARSLSQFFDEHKTALIDSLEGIQANMKKRGGGLIDLQLQDLTDRLDNYYQLHASFETGDAMGANFINSCLEHLASEFEARAAGSAFFQNDSLPEVVMSILSNYVPECRVQATVSCAVDQLTHAGISGAEFAKDFVNAVQMANQNVYRAVTHNKGIMNGIDAVVVATGNDFRAVEAGMHAYAARDGQYRSLTKAWVEDEVFHFQLDAPLALGTVGGLTRLHPLVGVSMKILGQPTAKDLMRTVAVAGLAQNFAAVRSLVTTGIQKGHMKMHLLNILNQLGASETEKGAAVKHFETETVSHSSVSRYIESLRA